MDTKSPPSTNKPTPKPVYISSSGHVLETPPLTARLTRASSDIYNFFGLYIVSLFSLDPYTAAQNSQFNTRGRPNAYQERSRWGGAGSTRLGVGGGGGGGGGARGPGSDGAGPRRRIGGVDDVRGPECGSCG